MATPPKPSEILITDPQKLLFLDQELKRQWGIHRGIEMKVEKQDRLFAKPVSLDRSRLASLKNNSYMVTEKSDGVAFCLLLGRWPSEIDKKRECFSVMVDSNEKNPKWYHVCVYAQPDFFKGTLLIGELVWESIPANILHPNLANLSQANLSTHTIKLQTFLVFDASMIRGKLICQDSYLYRYELLQSILMDSNQSLEAQKMDAKEWLKMSEIHANAGLLICAVNSFGLTMRYKKCLPAHATDTMWRSREKLFHHSDGLIFTPVHEPIKHGTQWTLFKYKLDHTVDFLFEGTKNPSWNWKMFVQGDVQDPFGQTHQPFDLTTSIFLLPEIQKYYRLNQISNPPFFKLELCMSVEFASLVAKADKLQKTSIQFVGECEMQLGPIQSENDIPFQIVYCRFTRPRSEKPFANHVVTFDRTLLNVIENITPPELFQFTR